MERNREDIPETDDSPEALEQKADKAIRDAHSRAEGRSQQYLIDLAEKLETKLGEIGISISPNDLYSEMVEQIITDGNFDRMNDKELFTEFLLKILEPRYFPKPPENEDNPEYGDNPLKALPQVIRNAHRPLKKGEETGPHLRDIANRLKDELSKIGLDIPAHRLFSLMETGAMKNCSYDVINNVKRLEIFLLGEIF